MALPFIDDAGAGDGDAQARRSHEVFPNAAGIDMGGSSHWVAVPRPAADEPVREFGTMTDDLNAMADWLLACGVDTVALESTGVYWIPVYEVLERRGLAVWLVDARQMKYVPGRKSDVQDCQWLQKLMSLGLLRAAWRPGDEVCVVRAVVRQREVLLAEQASWVQRMQKALVQMNLQLTEVLTDVMGMTGQAIVRAIVAGERDPKVLARHRNGRVKASAARHRAGADGQLARGAPVRARAGAGDGRQPSPAGARVRREDRGAAGTVRAVTTWNWPGRARSARKNTPRFDARTALARWAGVDLTRINGLAVTTVMTILSEIGPDLSRFANVKHFCSWLGLCPGTKISGGKVLSARTGAPPTGCARRSSWRP